MQDAPLSSIAGSASYMQGLALFEEFAFWHH